MYSPKHYERGEYYHVFEQMISSKEKPISRKKRIKYFNQESNDVYDIIIGSKGKRKIGEPVLNKRNSPTRQFSIRVFDEKSYKEQKQSEEEKKKRQSIERRNQINEIYPF